MFGTKNKTKKASSSGQATIRDNALILSLENAEVPLVARFDLDSLAQANFIVQSFDNFHQLGLRDFSGQLQPIAQFSNKMDAHQALHQILQALVDQNVTDNTPKKITIRRIIGMILQFFGILFLLSVAYVLYTALHAGRMPNMNAINPVGDAAQIQNTPELPEGMPQDVDGVFTPPEAQQ